jgi:hypothetical protein
LVGVAVWLIPGFAELAWFSPPQATVVKHKVRAKQTTVNLRSIVIITVFMFCADTNYRLTNIRLK